MNKQSREVYDYLLQFLREEKALTKFIKNVRKHKSISVKHYVTNLLHPWELAVNEIKSLIGASFAWVDTEEGAQYWINIERKWWKFIEEHDVISSAKASSRLDT